MKKQYTSFHFLPLSFSALLFLISLAYPEIAHSQTPHILDDQSKLKVSKEVMEYIYNWEFEKAEQAIAILSKGAEGHPVIPFAKAMVIYWKIAPVDYSDTDLYPKHLRLLEEASALAEEMLEVDEDDIEAQFFKMASRSMVMKHYADSGQPMKAISEARDVYKIIKDGFDYKDDLVEFYFTTGIYNYYREYYPDRYPVYKPFAIFFQSGDKKLGLEQLVHSAKYATFTKIEAYSYLVYINLRYEKNNEKAISYAQQLVNKYPQNLLFLTQYTEILLLTGRYQQVYSHATKLQESPDPYYKAVGLLFGGMAEQEQHQDLEKAFALYTKTLELIKGMSYRFALQKTYLYYNLSKVYIAKGNSEKAREYYQLAKDHDANDYLKTVEKPDF